ncbi:MAG: tripartite tricarboxylate transporter substrate binding protein [Burkholderiales bacterium]|nr:tripartite tricarboxylate transporter substrate binding protein [Burkholderiales bacterium]
MFTRHLTKAAAAAAACAVLAAHAQQKPDAAPGYPVKPVRMLVGNAPGGGIDLTARAVAQKLTDRWGRPFVVDNRPGGTGLIAIDLTAGAAPDGYTLLVTSGSLVSSATVQKRLPFDPRRALAPVTQLTTVAYVLMVNPAVPAKTVKELIAHAKSRPHPLNFGSSGVGGIGHLAGELLASMSGVKMVHVPYKGGGLVLLDMISGQIQLGFTATISGMPHVRAGRLRVLGISSPKRTAALPDIPTIAESGLPGFDLVNWYGVFAPAATPPAIVTALQGEILRILGSAEVRAMFAKDGADAEGSATPAAFRKVFENEVAKWEKYVKLPGFAEALK